MTFGSPARMASLDLISFDVAVTSFQLIIILRPELEPGFYHNRRP